MGSYSEVWVYKTVPILLTGSVMGEKTKKHID